MKQLLALILLLAGLFITNNIQAQSIKKYTESASIFDKGPELSNNTYPESSMYRAYKKGKTGAASLSKLQNQVENKIREFAKKENKDFVILGQRTSTGPYILGRYPQTEIVFALVDKK